MKTKAQLATQFAWIFILVAGAIILIFFISIVFKQKAISQTKLSAEVLTQLETILTGSGLSSGTSNIIDTPEIHMELICDESGFSQYVVNNIDGPENFPQPIFASDTIKGKQLLTWALEFSTPFKITNFLYLSDPNIKYVFINPNPEITRAFPDEFTSEITSAIDYIETSGFHKIRLVFSTQDPTTLQLPKQLQDKDLDVSAVRLASGTATFYKRSDKSLVTEGSFPYLDQPKIDMPSLFGAIFSQDLTSYECNMKKAFRKMSLVAAIYADREANLKRNFQQRPTVYCVPEYYTGSIASLAEDSIQCSSDIRSCIGTIEEDISEIERNQNSLVRHSCPLIY